MTTTHEVALSAGATLRFATTPSAVEQPSDKLPSFVVSGLPGARIALRRGFVDDASLALHIACVEAPSDRWAPGIEDVVLSVASGVAHRAMSERVTIEQWNVDAAVFQDQHFEQKLNGKALRDGTAVKLLGKHLLGFEGDKHDVVLCSVLCDEPTSGSACMELVETTQLGNLVPAPDPSLLVRSVLFAAEKPLEAGAVVGVMGAFLVGVVLAKRPRPKP